MRFAAAFAVSAALLGTLTACNDDAANGSQDIGGTATPSQAVQLDPKAALAASAAVMQKAGNSKIVLSEQGKTISTGSVGWQDKSSFELVSADTNVVRGIGEAIYMSVPKAQQASAAGKHWVKVDQSNENGRQNAVAFLTFEQMTNPVVQLSVAAASGQLTKVGTESVSGAETVHYKSVQQAATMVAAMTGLSADQRKSVLKGLEASGLTATSEFWINAKQELVQSKVFGDKQDVTTTFVYSGLGTAPKIEAPAASDTLGWADGEKLVG
ncbi:hypothetical protein [Kitasatospora sp. NPDC050543]|uniref:hypothetical protein n=1 Tax=Kitasatospora sp. NPDC050543 TaxID=3364054 RepID=UPI0037B6D8A5